MRQDTANGTTLQRATYSIDETANILGISRTSAYRAAKTGEIPTIKIGRRILVGRQTLLEIIGKHGCTVPMFSTSTTGLEVTR